LTTHFLYHANCTDGLGAKYAAWKRYGEASDINYLPVNYSANPRLPKEIVQGDTVYLMDFCYPAKLLEELSHKVKTLVILDHHQTAFEILAEIQGGYSDVSDQQNIHSTREWNNARVDFHLDRDRSGATLAWDFFHPDQPYPKLLSYIQDRDLWQFKLHDTNAVHEALFLLKGDMKEWDKVAEEGFDQTKLIGLGRPIVDYNQIAVERISKRAQVLDFLGLRAAIVNTTEHQSDVGSYLLQNPKEPTDLAILFTVHQDTVGLSFRSLKGTQIDVATLAKTYFGGGGHFHAAGGRCNLQILGTILSGSYLPISKI